MKKVQNAPQLIHWQTVGKQAAYHDGYGHVEWSDSEGELGGI